MVYVNYLLAFIVLFDDDGLLTSLSSCEEDDDSSFLHAEHNTNQTQSVTRTEISLLSAVSHWLPL